MTSSTPTPKILPSAVDILRCVREVTRDLLAPALTGASERSAAATIDHMLRYVERLVAHEGQALLEEEVRLKTVLTGVADWLARQPEHAALAGAMRTDCARQPDPAHYPTLVMMEDRVAILRQHACDALIALHRAGDAKGSAGELSHLALREYIRWQLAKEGELVEPAFLGHGPRR